MQTDVKQTIAVAATAQLQKYVKTTATNITKARIVAIVHKLVLLMQV